LSTIVYTRPTDIGLNALGWKSQPTGEERPEHINKLHFTALNRHSSWQAGITERPNDNGR